MKVKGSPLQDDGTWKQTELAGNVYRAINKRNPSTPGGDKKSMITWAAPDEYSRNIASLNRQYPEYWQLILQAAKGQPGAFQEPCGDHRAHVCHLCLGQRPNVQCSKGKGGDKGGGGKGK